jgi:hypothetical protein
MTPAKTQRKSIVISTPWNNNAQSKVAIGNVFHGGEIFLRSLAFARDDSPLACHFAPWRPFDLAQDMFGARNFLEVTWPLRLPITLPADFRCMRAADRPG